MQRFYRKRNAQLHLFNFKTPIGRKPTIIVQSLPRTLESFTKPVKYVKYLLNMSSILGVVGVC